MPHKFKIGQTVELRRPGWDHSAAVGPYVVTNQLPERDGEFEYHIRSPEKPHERIARESELSGA
jgi:hypothetical protein